jgi:hypothetical protein
MSSTSDLTNEDINDISLSITKVIEDKTLGNVNDMYHVYLHSLSVFLISTCIDKDHLMVAVEELKYMCIHYYDEHQKILAAKNL